MKSSGFQCVIQSRIFLHRGQRIARTEYPDCLYLIIASVTLSKVINKARSYGFLSPLFSLSSIFGYDTKKVFTFHRVYSIRRCWVISWMRWIMLTRIHIALHAVPRCCAFFSVISLYNNASISTHCLGFNIDNSLLSWMIDWSVEAINVIPKMRGIRWGNSKTRSMTFLLEPMCSFEGNQ